MKKEELEVGMVIEFKGNLGMFSSIMDREVAYLGRELFFYDPVIDEQSTCRYEGIMLYKDLQDWQPKQEKPELFWLWNLPSDNGRYLSAYHYNESGFSTNKREYSGDSPWEYLSKFKIPGTAITKDGKPYKESGE